MKKLAVSIACLVVLTLAATGAWANAIPQLTLSSSSHGAMTFADTGSSMSFWFNGTVAQCGHANCVSGNALLEPQTMLGTYWMWMTGGIPTMTGGPDHFTVNMGSTVIHLALQLTGFPDTLTTSLSLTDLFGGTSSAPTFDGTFANAATTGLYVTADFPSGVNGIVDFTIKLGNGTNIASLGVGQHMSGPISSGELVPSVPEPGTLALMGTGVLSLAGLIRRKIK